jgi:primosomal protein N'
MPPRRSSRCSCSVCGRTASSSTTSPRSASRTAPTSTASRYVDALPDYEELPESLLRIVGLETGREQEAGEHEPGSIDLLLTNDANPEQELVIHRLEETGAVLVLLVQGPPGTGKTHTIANLVGHLLAQKKSVLVTSHTSKALRVVRDKVAKPLQSLCVSVFYGDEESSKQL